MTMLDLTRDYLLIRGHGGILDEELQSLQASTADAMEEVMVQSNHDLDTLRQSGDKGDQVADDASDLLRQETRRQLDQVTAEPFARLRYRIAASKASGTRDLANQEALVLENLEFGLRQLHHRLTGR